LTQLYAVVLIALVGPMFIGVLRYKFTYDVIRYDWTKRASLCV